MARNLVKSGHSVVAFDVNKSAIEKLVSSSPTSNAIAGASSPEDVARKSQVVITMLPSSPHVAEVFEGPHGILQGLRKGTLCIDSSTIEPQVSRRVATAVQKVGGLMVDAPVSGGVGGAEQGTLTFMVGGPQEAFQQALPLLKKMGKNIEHCGEWGSGQAAKICNNLVLGISMAAVSEAMLLGQQLGVDPKILARIINTSSGRCWSSDTYNPVPGVMPNVPSSRGYSGGFAVDLMAKDVSLAVAAANALKTPLPMGGPALQLYNLISRQGYGGKDFSSVFEFLSVNNKK